MSQAATFQLVGGALCLDLANTVNCYDCETLTDDLGAYSDLVRWGEQAGTVAGRHARRLLREAAERPRDAAVMLEQAKVLRGAIYRIVADTIDGRAPTAHDLDVLNSALARALARSKVIPTGGGFEWEWDTSTSALDRVLWPVARSAAELLTSDDLGRVRRCGGTDCTWLFVDTSKNKSRRWCEMKGCGNRAKSRRHYERTRASR